MKLRLPRVVAVALLCAWPLLVFAQPDADPRTEHVHNIAEASVTDHMPQSSAFWTAFLTVVALPFLGKALHLLAELGFTWARSKGWKKAEAWERAYRIADSLIGYVDAETRAAREAALSPGSEGGSKVTAAEAQKLQALALEAGKKWLGQGGLEQLAKEAGIVAGEAEGWLRGVIEERFNVKKIAETAAENSAPAPAIASSPK